MSNGASGRALAPVLFERLAVGLDDAVLLAARDEGDHDVRIRWANPAFTELWGHPLGEIVGAEAGLLIGPDTDLGALRTIEEALDAGDVARLELTLHTRAGAPVRVQCSYVRVTDDDGVTWYLSTYRDSTAEAEARAALWQREEWAAAILEGVSDLVVVADEAAAITWVSPSVLTILGYDPDEVVGRPAFDFVHPDDGDEVAEQWLAAVEDRLEPGLRAYRLLHRDGSWRWASISASNRLGHPAVRGVVLSAVDITDRVAGEERLRHSEQWAQALVQRGADLVAVVDGDGNVSFISPAVEDILGIPPAELVGASHLDLVHPDDVPNLARLVGEDGSGAAAHGGIELRLRARSGGWRTLSIVSTDLRDEPAVQGIVLAARDVTNRRLMEDLLAESADLLESVARGAPLEITLQKVALMVEHLVAASRCAVGIADEDHTVRMRAAPNLGRDIVDFLDALPPDSLTGRRLRDAVEVETYRLEGPLPGVPDALFDRHGLRQCWVVPVRAPADDELLGSISVFTEDARELGSFEADVLGRARNVAAIAIERRRFESTLAHQARYDALTGLPNRTLLSERTRDAIARAGRRGTGVAVLFIDLDRFKVINDSVGHAIGDQLLLQVTERLREPLLPGDTLGRFGGDEFVVVCGQVTDEGAAAERAKRFLGALTQPFDTDAGEVFVTASVGIAFSADPATDPEALLRNADVAMYRAKAQGRNQPVVFQETLDLEAVERLALEQALRHGIEVGQFELHFQPVVRLRDGGMAAVESLVRWNRPSHGTVPPGRFIPLAEETGLIVPLGWWILGEACRQAARWPALPGGGAVEVAVNLSARQLARPELIEVVSRTLSETGLPAERLCVEVTESVLVHDVEQATGALEALKALGVRIAIDDFGTGYASLEYVRHFSMADYLKIDRSFVEGVDRPGSNEAAIVSAAVALARSLGLTVIAEGVETTSQMEALRALDCDLAQGFLFSRPVPYDAAVALLASQSS